MDFEQFLADPVAGLARVAHFCGLAVSDSQLQQVAHGDVASGYSKDPTMAYDRSSRQAELDRSARSNAGEIASGLRWAEAFSG